MTEPKLKFPEDFYQFVDHTGCFNETVNDEQLAYFIEKLKGLLNKVTHKDVEISSDDTETIYVIYTNPNYDFYGFDGHLVIRVNLIDFREVRIELSERKDRQKYLSFDGDSKEGEQIKVLLRKMDNRLSFSRAGLKRQFSDLSNGDCLYFVMCDDGVPTIKAHEINIVDKVIKTPDCNLNRDYWRDLNCGSINSRLDVFIDKQDALEYAETKLEELEERVDYQKKRI